MRAPHGGREGTWTVQCTNTVPVVPAHLLERALTLIQATPTGFVSAHRGVVAHVHAEARAAIDNPNAAEAECGYNDSVDGHWATRHLFLWSCPWCGADNETEVDL